MDNFLLKKPQHFCTQSITNQKAQKSADGQISESNYIWESSLPVECTLWAFTRCLLMVLLSSTFPTARVQTHPSGLDCREFVWGRGIKGSPSELSTGTAAWAPSRNTHFNGGMNCCRWNCIAGIFLCRYQWQDLGLYFSKQWPRNGFMVDSWWATRVAKLLK